MTAREELLDKTAYAINIKFPFNRKGSINYGGTDHGLCGWLNNLRDRKVDLNDDVFALWVAEIYIILNNFDTDKIKPVHELLLTKDKANVEIAVNMLINL